MVELEERLKELLKHEEELRQEIANLKHKRLIALFEIGKLDRRLCHDDLKRKHMIIQRGLDQIERLITNKY